MTVATIVERDGTYLMVEETTRAGLRLRTSRPDAWSRARPSWRPPCAALEETGYHVRPTALVGIYRWLAPGTGITYVRFAFAADVVGFDAERPLDAGIVRALWLPYGELAACLPRHRSPLVQRCIDDHRAGRRQPLDLFAELD